MAKEEQEQGQNTVNMLGGLNTDSSLVTQPPGSTRFVFTGVNETKEGDINFVSNEESNAPCYVLPTQGGVPYVPVGKVYIGNEETALLLAHAKGESIIAIIDSECNLTVVVNDFNQTEKLNFKVTEQIDATFKLRNGCERTIYWVDPKPRLFIFDKEEEFKNPITGKWDISKFSLFKTYKKIPVVLDIEVVDAGGVLSPGSYNFSVQYLDENFNPTEFVTSTETVMVYNTPSTSIFREKRGATKETNDSYLNFEDSNKAIKIVFDPNSLDTTFPFYRLAITEANAGGGLISDTKYTSEISTRNTTFYYTGLNYESTGTQAEVTMFNNIIEKAQSIEQIENRLILGNIEGKQVNYCKLQKYASKITTDLITKTIVISDNDKSNSKDPAAHFNGIGYMPGEIYSLAIVYIFADNSVSPALHIPGKSNLVPLNQMFSSGPTVYPMSNINNACTDTNYIDNNTCGTDSYWGVDSQGTILKNTPVRHHRFPLRTDYNIPFVTKISPTAALAFVKNLSISAYKIGATCPAECDPAEPVTTPACAPTPANFGSPGDRTAYTYELNYTEDLVPNVITNVVDPQEFVVTVGDDTTQDVYYQEESGNIYGASIIINNIVENFEYPTVPNTVTMTGPTLDSITGMYYYSGVSSVTGMSYKVVIGIGIKENSDDLYSSQIFGLNFSNIRKPSLADTNGEEVVGYYIVRQERKESDKTIIDSAILTSTTKEKNFVAQGLLAPQFATPAEQSLRIKKDIVGLIYPEHKFNSKKYSTFSKIVQQGKFNKVNTIVSRSKIRDVVDGSGYVSGKHKASEKDDDGFTLQIKTRDNITNFVAENTFTLDSDNIKELYYLPALGNKLTLDSSDTSVDVFNLASDNQVGIINLKQDYTFNTVSSFPYVYLYRDILEPYSNFRLDPYYKESKNPERFNPATEIGITAIWNGDSYISSIRYVNSIYFDTRMKKRKGKTNVFSFVLAVVLVIAAAALFLIPGVGTVAAIGLASVAAGLVGAATTLVLSGIKQDAWNKAYNVLYKQGLRETITDSYMLDDTDPVSGEPRGFRKNPQDDEIQWLGDCLNLWFESGVNMGLRHGATDSTPDFLNAPGLIESGTTDIEGDREYFGIHSVKSNEVPPTTALDFHMVKKLTYLDANRKGGRAYIGIASAEVYTLNPDYTRRNKQKAFNHLGLEYDCCSDCVETFPHRWHWSEQSFQEGVTDNFRMFLPNNYKDLEAETGEITDIFRIQNNLYIHTKEGLWHCPQTFQERITSDIISFIGTGEYFSVPPRKIVDDNNSSAGNSHKWARTKTKYGVLFPSFKEKKWYLFDGQQLKPISDNGNSNYFKTHMDFLIEQQYYKTNLKEYPYSNNPSNPIGVGFLSTYDSNKERLIVTKKDTKITNLPTSNYEICEGVKTIIFNNMSQVIAARLANGWNYVGIENCLMKFQKTTYPTINTTVNQYSTISNDTKVFVFYDTTGSFTSTDRANLKAATVAWYQSIRPNEVLDVNKESANFKHYNLPTERWLDAPRIIQLAYAHTGKTLCITYVNESAGNTEYYLSTGTVTNVVPPYTGVYTTDYNDFKNNRALTFSSFIGINYPIVTNNSFLVDAKRFLQHSLAAIKGRNYTLAETNDLKVNSIFTTQEWLNLKSSLLTNPYSALVDGAGVPGLEKYGWFVKSDRNNLGTDTTPECPTATGDIISPCQLKIDLNAILQEATAVTQTTLATSYPVTETEYEEGTVFVPQMINNGYTMSYSLKRQEWVGWHPYIPSFYMHVQEKFYSWLQGSTSLWKHNIEGSYQTFYGVRYPFIVEYVDNPSPLISKIWSGIMFQTEAKKYDLATQEYNDQRNVTFNKVLLYNTEQISGELTLVPKQNSSVDYLYEQTKNVSSNQIIIDRNERDWTLNGMRDFRDNYDVPMFIKEVSQLQSNYYIDKIVNTAAINFNKDWTQQLSFRDKYLVVRLIFDNFADTRLTFNFSALAKQQSER